LTSKVLQKRFLTAARKKKEVIVARKYMLIPVDSYQNLIDSAGNRVLTIRNATKEEEEVKEEVKEEEEEDKKKFIPPTKEETQQYFFTNGYTKQSGLKAWQYYDAGDWKDSTGKAVKSWKQKMRGVWFKDKNLIIQKINNKSGFQTRQDRNKEECIKFINEG